MMNAPFEPSTWRLRKMIADAERRFAADVDQELRRTEARAESRMAKAIEAEVFARRWRRIWGDGA